MTQTKPPPMTKGNAGLAIQVLEEVIAQGIIEFCLCAGSRNAPLVYPLVHSSHARVYHWTEERSAAFFALGRIKATGRPVAVVTTSGTAVGELLPAVMEAYYTGLPLVLITADRPPRFRKTGAPQSVEQVGIFGCYAHEIQDLVEGDRCSLDNWTRQGPLHLNVCFEEPSDQECQAIRLCETLGSRSKEMDQAFYPADRFLSFLQKCRYPLVVVGEMPPEYREGVIQFLQHLKAPVYAEGISQLREDARLEPFRIKQIENLWRMADESRYPIDGILRLGGIPTARFWRDLEHKHDSVTVCSVSEKPFAGLSHSDVIQTNLPSFFAWGQRMVVPHSYPFAEWKQKDQASYVKLLTLFDEEPFAESSLIRSLSARMPIGSKVYLGNSLPIREWDQAAVFEQRGYLMGCSRGTNGIDGQMSTFLGYCSPEQDNWSILGDLTALYDMAAPWIMPQLAGLSANVVVVNNSGAGIFARMYRDSSFQNRHQLSFGPLAQFWGWRYERWNAVPSIIESTQGARLIELIPDEESTIRFLKKLKG